MLTQEQLHDLIVEIAAGAAQAGEHEGLCVDSPKMRLLLGIAIEHCVWSICPEFFEEDESP